MDLRNCPGLLRIIFKENDCGAESFVKVERLRSEFVIAVTNTVEACSDGVNENLATGAIEARAKNLRTLAESETSPFPMEEGSKTKEELRLKYRYPDLKKLDLQKNIMTRSRVAVLTGVFLTEGEFLEIGIPALIGNTPEEARGYLVPSRAHPDSLCALLQSLQLYRQLLMCSGHNRYLQLVRCYRGEDLQADKQPEFTQIDMESSFVSVDDVINISERLLRKPFKEICNFDIQLLTQRMTWRGVMDRFGSDKPDLCSGMELKNVPDVVKDYEFIVLKDALESGGSVKRINAEGQGTIPRKKTDALVEYVKGFGIKGPAYVAIQGSGTIRSSFAKLMENEEMTALIEVMGDKSGDLSLFTTDEDKVVFDVLGNLRLELTRQLGLLKEDDFRFLWATELLPPEYSEEQGCYAVMHYPFTMSIEEDWPPIDESPGAICAKAHDIVLNDTEIGGGPVRTHQSGTQSKMLEVLGFTPEKAERQSGLLLSVSRHGVPSHMGLIYGLDRVMTLMVGADNIRDAIAFPKVKDASCLMTEAPMPVECKRLKGLRVKIVLLEKEIVAE